MFDWKAEYDTGISEIDTQHRQVFAIAGELHAAILEGRGKTELGTMFAGLVSFSRRHFEAEEALMKAANYAGLAQHKAEHEELAATLRGVTKITPDVTKLLNDWLTHHITDTDRKMGAALRLR